MRGFFFTTIKNKIIQKKVIWFLRELDFICVAMRTDWLWGFERENGDKRNNYRISNLQISASNDAGKNNKEHICFDIFLNMNRCQILTSTKKKESIIFWYPTNHLKAFYVFHKSSKHDTREMIKTSKSISTQIRNVQLKCSEASSCSP